MRYTAVLIMTCLLSWVVAPVEAQTVYRCTEGDRTVYTDRPCPGASVVSKATPADSPPTPAPRAYTPPVARGGVLPSASELTKRCADGDAGACDFLACANRNDQAACARARGAPQSSGTSPGWTAVSTRDVQHPQKDEVAGIRMIKEQEITIACDSGARGIVVARRDLGRYRTPDGSAHSSLAAAAAVLCAP